MLNKITQAAVTIGVVLVSACAGTPPTHFYVLEALSPAATQIDTAKKRQIGIGPITMPALLERKQIVTRAEGNSVQIAEFHQWAEPIKDNVAEVLTQNMSRLQPGDIFRTYPWSAYGAVNYRLIIDVVRFDAQPGKSANLEARWAVMDEKSHTIVTNGQSGITRGISGEAYPEAVSALSQVLSDFSQELSQALQALAPAQSLN
ncbi:MAG: PqiC family protein [Methylovulum sp.]|nr:PqiC family protein [Methylovulum sp.]